MIPKEVIDGKIQQYKNKAMLILELHYDTDVEMTEHLYCDIMKLLTLESQPFIMRAEKLSMLQGQNLDVLLINGLLKHTS